MPNVFTKWLCNILLPIVLVLSNGNAYTQTKSGLQVSLLTCSPGDELYSIFGHTAIRVVDSVSLTDVVYNYGTFNFSDPNFYVKFTRGKLLYYLSVESFSDFALSYYYEKRTITEQILNITEDEKMSIRSALQETLKEENRYYQYDFFLDNCTTRPRDLLVKLIHPKPELPAVMDIKTTFREAIHLYLDSGKQYWSKLGIDLLLGAKTDAVMSKNQQLFLPDNLMYALDKSTPQNMVLATVSPYQITSEPKPEPPFTPLMIISILSLFIALVTTPFLISNKGIVLFFDRLVYFITGLLGVILVLMWVATDHSMTKSNYNILWALPTHLIISLFVSSQKRWVKYYFLMTAILAALVALCWFFLPQKMNPALLPWLVLLVYRSFAKYFTHGNKTLLS